MGSPKPPRKVKLVIGMLAKDKRLFDKVEGFFIERFGRIDFRSPIIAFKYTKYYKAEMGEPLKRRFVAFKRLIDPQRLPDIKIWTNALELKFSRSKTLPSRKINIDPGYISDSKLVLATTKDYAHRLYLARGMYGEVTLYWHKGSFRPWGWTYPDYRTKEYIEIFNSVRLALAKRYSK